MTATPTIDRAARTASQATETAAQAAQRQTLPTPVALARGRAAMVPAGDFASPVIAQYADPDVVGVFRFPGQPYGRQPLVVGGDVAVLPKRAGPGGVTGCGRAGFSGAVPGRGCSMSGARGAPRRLPSFVRSPTGFYDS